MSAETPVVETPAAPAAPAAPTVPGATPELNVDVERASAEIGSDLFGKSPEEPAAKPDDKPAAPSADKPPVETKPDPTKPPATPAAPVAPAATGDWTPEQIKALEAWQPETRELLKKLPPELKPVFEHIVKRETDMLKGFEQIKSETDVAKAFREVVKPYLPAMQFYNIDPMKMTSQLLATQQVLAFGSLDQKVNVVNRLLKDFQIPLDRIGQDAPALDPQVAAAVAPLQAELGQLRSTLTAEQQRIANERKAASQREVDEFVKTHPHFDELSDVIAQLLESKVATSLSDAYDTALWRNPALRSKELARQQKERDDAEAKKRADEAAAARAATAANVTTSAKPQVSASAPAVGSMEDTIRGTYAEIQKRTA